MSKPIKKVVSFNIQEETYTRFKEWCKVQDQDMSPIVDQILSLFVETSDEQ